MNVRILISSSDKDSGKSIEKTIATNFSQLKISCRFDADFSVLESLALEKVEIIIVDLFSDKDLEFLDYIDLDLYKIIFIAENFELLEKSMKHLPFGFLLHPVKAESLRKLINRAIKDIITADVDDSIIHIPRANGQESIRKSDIIRCESDSNYTKLVLQDSNQHVVVSRTLKYVFDKYLDSKDFLRTHKSHVVNIRYIVSKKVKENRIQLTNGDIIPVSRSNMKETTDKLEKQR